MSYNLTFSLWTNIENEPEKSQQWNFRRQKDCKNEPKKTVQMFSLGLLQSCSNMIA